MAADTPNPIGLIRINKLLPIAMIAMGFVSAKSRAEDWPQFLGENRDGLSSETGLMERWPAGGPTVLWRVPGGVGMSAVAVAGDRAITTWNAGQDQFVAAMDTRDGSELWTTKLAPRYENGQGNGPRGTPTVAGDHVYVYTGEGVLACVALADGEPVWSVDVVRQTSGRPAEYGMACSPLVVGDLVIVTAGGRGSAVVAIDRQSGKTRWSAGDGSPGYSSPALLAVGDQPQVVAFTGNGVIGLDPQTGKTRWTYPFKTPYDCNTATPIIVDGKVFISAGENHGCVMLEIRRSGEKETAYPVWQSVDVKSVMRNEWQTSVAIDGNLYGFDNVGSAGPTTHLTCVNAKTGDVIWQKARFGKGNLVAADGHLWITTMKGEFVMAKASPDGYVELGRKRLFGKTRQTVSIANGKAFIRDDREVICIDIGG